MVFENVYRKMERELQERKKKMAEIIEVSNQAYEQRDTFQMEIAAIEQVRWSIETTFPTFYSVYVCMYVCMYVCIESIDPARQQEVCKIWSMYVLSRVGQQVFRRSELAAEDRHAEGRRAGHRAEEQLLQARQVDRAGRTPHIYTYIQTNTITYKQNLLVSAIIRRCCPELTS